MLRTEFRMASPEAFIARPSEEFLSGLTKSQFCTVAMHYDYAPEKNIKETFFLA